MKISYSICKQDEVFVTFITVTLAVLPGKYVPRRDTMKLAKLELSKGPFEATFAINKKPKNRVVTIYTKNIFMYVNISLNCIFNTYFATIK